MIVLEIIIGLIALVILVAIHEFGHAIVAKKSGVVVEEFGIGLPPVAKKTRLKSGMIFSINWLPLGGFVKLKGEYDAANNKGDYGSATLWQKTKIMFAGVVFNWIFAAFLLTILALVGLPKILPNQFTVMNDTKTTYKPVQITSVIKDGPAENAKLEVGDEIVKFADQDIDTVESLINESKKYQNESVSLTYIRNNSENTTKIELGDESDGYVIGAGLGQNEFINATWSAPIVGVATTAQFTWLTLQGIVDIFGNLFSANIQSVGDSVSGPIGIIGTIFPSAVEGGLVQLMFLTAIISLSLAVMNILPIPALDGGRWLTTIIFRLLKKDLTKEREEKIQAVGFYILMVLVILVTFNDIARLF